VPASGDPGDGRRRFRSLDLRAREGQDDAKTRGGRPSRSSCGEGRASTCSPSAELRDVNGLTSTESRIKQRRRSRSGGGCDDRRLLAEHDVEVPLGEDEGVTLRAVASTEGADCSRVSVSLARGIRCGFGGWWWLYPRWW
jgi:hypothetical protein